MKIKLFSHDDRDGIGAIILGKLVFGESLDYEICNYDDINEKVSEFLLSKDLNTYGKVFITDISVDEEVAKAIDIANKQYTSFVLLDHHPTSLELNKYNWAKVEIMLNEKEKTSGTRMFYDWLVNNNYLNKKKTNDVLFDFVEDTRRYDVWQWKTENDLIPKQWNDLFYILGKDRFMNTIIEDCIKANKFEFTETQKLLLELEQNKIDNYIESKNKEIIEKDILGYKAGIVFGEQYHSELGNRLCEVHPELDFIIIINMAKAVSYRSIGNKVDLGKDIAAIFGGGGHINAAGSPISDEVRNKVISLLFDK